MGSGATKLGRGPSVLASDADARVQRSAGWGPTDFSGAFTPGLRFAVRLRPSGPFRVVGPVRVERIGEITVSSGRLSVFDALDTTWMDENRVTLGREVPNGTFPVYRSVFGTEALVLLVRFVDTPVASWSPVRFDAGPMPVPPWLPTARVRFSLALGDAETVAGVLPAPLADGPARNVLRAIFGEAPLAEPEPPRMPDPGFRALYSALGAGEAAVCAGGIVAVAVDRGLPAWWGLAADGTLAALAFDHCVLRIAREEVIDVPIASVRSGEVREVGDVRILAASANEVRVWVPSTSTFRSVVFLDRESGAPTVTGGEPGREVVVRARAELPAATRLRFVFDAPSLPAPRVPPLADADLADWLRDVIGT